MFFPKFLTATALMFACGALSAQTLYVPSGAVGTSSTGNVGVGTSSPAAKLDIYAGTTTGLYITTANSGPWGMVVKNASYSGGGFSLYQGDDGWSWLFSGYPTGGRIALGPNGSMGLNAGGGNVGVGTNAPSSARLVVASQQQSATNTIVGEFTKDGGSNSDGSAILRLSRSIGGESTDLELNSGGAGPFRFGNYSDTLLVNGQNLANGPYGSIHFVTNQASRLTIGGGTIAGTVGVGTTSPVAALDVIRPGNSNVYENGIRANRPDSQGQYAFMGYGQASADAYFGSVYTGAAGTYGAIHFRQYTQGMAARDVLNIDTTGNVGIGTTNPTQKLSVNGTVRAKEVIVDTGWSDYVFNKCYRLKALSEVEAHINADGHLPGIPSAQEVADHGISVGEMQAKLLAKIEELTLHAIAQEKRMTKLEGENAELRAAMKVLERRQ